MESHHILVVLLLVLALCDCAPSSKHRLLKSTQLNSRSKPCSVPRRVLVSVSDLGPGIESWGRQVAVVNSCAGSGTCGDREPCCQDDATEKIVVKYRTWVGDKKWTMVEKQLEVVQPISCKCR